MNPKTIIDANIKARKLRQSLAESLSTKKLSYQEFELLYTIQQNPGIRSSDLANTLYIERATSPVYSRSLIRMAIFPFIALNKIEESRL